MVVELLILWKTKETSHRICKQQSGAEQTEPRKHQKRIQQYKTLVGKYVLI